MCVSPSAGTRRPIGAAPTSPSRFWPRRVRARRVTSLLLLLRSVPAPPCGPQGAVHLLPGRDRVCLREAGRAARWIRDQSSLDSRAHVGPLPRGADRGGVEMPGGGQFLDGPTVGPSVCFADRLQVGERPGQESGRAQRLVRATRTVAGQERPGEEQGGGRRWEPPANCDLLARDARGAQRPCPPAFGYLSRASGGVRAGCVGSGVCCRGCCPGAPAVGLGWGRPGPSPTWSRGPGARGGGRGALGEVHATQPVARPGGQVKRGEGPPSGAGGTRGTPARRPGGPSRSRTAAGSGMGVLLPWVLPSRVSVETANARTLILCLKIKYS